MSKKDFTSVLDLTKDEILSIFQKAKQLKEKPFSDKLKNKTLAMIFEKSSTRTRVSFEVGIQQLGGQALFLSSKDIQLGRGETIEDTAKVLSRYVDIIMARTYKHETIEQLAEHSTIPVINGLSDLLHPCQAMTDYFTILEHTGSLTEKIVYIGDGSSNMAHSVLLLGAILGSNFTIISSTKYFPSKDILNKANELAKTSGAQLLVTDNLSDIKDARVIYTDVWTSMGQETEKEQRLNDLKAFQVNKQLTQKAKNNFVFMHCLPAHRGEEVTSEIIDDPQHSIVFDQAENRLHVQKAIMSHLLEPIHKN